MTAGGGRDEDYDDATLVLLLLQNRNLSYNHYSSNLLTSLTRWPLKVVDEGEVDDAKRKKKRLRKVMVVVVVMTSCWND